jgi:hypothetical protein
MTNTAIPPPAVELLDLVARYRTAIVALLELIKRDGGYMLTNDQLLIAQIERLIDTNGAWIIQTQLDREHVK